MPASSRSCFWTALLLASAFASRPLHAQFTDAPGHVVIADNFAKDANNIRFSYFDAPRGISDAGVVAFKASYTGPSYAQGFWQGIGGLAQPLAARGMTAPGGGLFQDVVSYAADQIMTGAGYASFQANVRVPPSTTDVSGLYLVKPDGSLFRIAYEGQDAPGGGTFIFTAFQASLSWSMSRNGKIVFYATTTGGAGGGYYYARLNGSTPVVSAIALHGDAAPGTDGTFKLAGSSRGAVNTAISDSGLVTFTSATTSTNSNAVYQWDGTSITKLPNSSGSALFAVNNSGTVAFTPSDSYLRVGNTSGTQIICKYGDPVPGGTGIFNPGLWGKPVINDAGQVAFTAYGQGIFLWSGGTLKAIARGGQPAPGGGTMSDLSNAEPILTNTGYVIFKAGTSGGDRIFMSDGNEMVAAVSVGDRVAGEYIGTLSLGTHYNTTPFFSGQGAANDAGQIAYLADLDPTPGGSRDRTAVIRFTPPARWWTGGSGTWDVATHWKFSFTPGLQREVIIDPSGSAVVTGPAASMTVQSLQVGGGGGTTRLELAAGTTVTTTNGTTVKPNGVLAGLGTVSGDLVMDGTQELLDGGATQTLGTASYTNRSHTSFLLRANAEAAGTITAQTLQITDGAQVDLMLNSSGSTVDIAAAFWDERRAWRLFNATSATGGFVLGQVTADALGSAVSSARGTFSIVNTTTAVDLVWSPHQSMPELSTPADQMVVLGSEVNFDTAGTGGLLFYRWFRNNAVVSSSTHSAFTIASAALADAGNYTVSAGNDVGQATSAPATRLAVVDPSMNSLSLNKGAVLSLTVHAAGPPGTSLSFQWYAGSTLLNNGTNGSGGMVSGATTGTLKITSITQSEAGPYACVVSMGQLSIRTQDASVSVLNPPAVSPPADQLAAVGSRVDLAATVAGASSQQWKKNGVNVTTASGPTLTLPSLSLADAATYSITAVNAAGATTGAPATRVAVVNRVLPSPVKVLRNGTVTLAVTTAAPAGTLLTFQWYRDGSMLVNNATTTGALTSRLVLTKATKSQEGSYVCRVAMGAVSLDTVPVVVTETDPPTITTTTVPPAMVSAPFSWQLAADENATAFTISGLPSGLVANRSGLIQGTPGVSGSFNVKVSASNVAGAGAVKSFAVVISALPAGTAGTFSGLVARDASLNGSLGGWFTLSVAPLGTFTGTLKNGTASYALKGRLLASTAASPVLTLNLKRVSPPATLTFAVTFDGAGNAVSGTLTDGAATAVLDGRRHVWAGVAATAYAAVYNASVDLPAGSENDTAQPSGAGWQQLTVSRAGAVTGTGHTADGAAYTFSGSLWPEGSLPQFVLLYASHGSTTGLPQITPGVTVAANRVAGWVEQVKTGAASTIDRTYKAGIPLLRREVDGSPWIKPVTAAPIVLGLPDMAGNAHVSFSGGGVEAAASFGSLAQVFRINKTNTTTFPSRTAGNPCAVGMTIVAANGLFSGTFTLTDSVAGRPVARAVSYSGLLLSHRSAGLGCFLLPGLAPTPTTSPILGGRVELVP